MTATIQVLDGNEAVASVAYRLNEIATIYPITPASPMGEHADLWSSHLRPNVWGTVPLVYEMQSEAGAAGAMHGALQTGALTTTFTASQGLLLMLPNMYKIAGELTPAVIHVAARSLATHALSIFCDHSDVMSARATGFALLSSASVQEAHDFAAIAQAATLASRIPFVHFFDGFRTSHEISKISVLSDDDLLALVSEEAVAQHRRRALSPDHPVLRGTAQNPDVFFQSREASNRFYEACPNIVQQTMDRFAAATGRNYRCFDYHGASNAERVIVVMGSAAEAVHETVDHLNSLGARVGVVKVRLYRPFDSPAFLAALPPTVRSLAVLDRTKEPGSIGEPLYQDVAVALREAAQDGTSPHAEEIRLVGGRYGLSSKEFTPAMIDSVFQNLLAETPRSHFTVGIEDDVTHTSLPVNAEFRSEPDGVMRAAFFGLGSDGTVGANKTTIKIIGDETDLHVQGYFVYDSKKAGAVTVSHLRFGPQPIRSSYLIDSADFVACHQPTFLGRLEMLHLLADGGTFLLNAPWPADEVWDHLSPDVQQQLIGKRARFFVVDAARLARECGMGGRINTVMQACFFSISGVLPHDEAINHITRAIKTTYAKKGQRVVDMNLKAVDSAVDALAEVSIPQVASSSTHVETPVPSTAPRFVHDVTCPIMAHHGDELPVSRLPVDGTFPTGTAQYEKRNLAAEIPVWEPDLCIQCGKCVMVCPHAVIRSKAYDADRLTEAPATFKSADPRDRDWLGKKYTIQVAPEDCTGCAICVDVCPARDKSETRRKALAMQPQPPLRDAERGNWDFFLGLPQLDRRQLSMSSIRQQQCQQPLFEFSGACAGCGETPYLKLLTQLFGDRLLIANATGCSSIYGGNLPTTPWTTNAEGRGPAWSNSLFEDNAEFGLGFRLSVTKHAHYAAELLKRLAPQLGTQLVDEILSADQNDEAAIFQQRQWIDQVRQTLQRLENPDARRLLDIVDALAKKSIWIVGGDGWAYDIGYGGLDHVLASGENVNILVLDTEVYSNTGGQTSKATPRAAVAKFSAAGKPTAKKDLGLMAMTYGNVYVAGVAMGARDEHTLRAFLEAEAYDGPSLIIAYSHCIAHGIHMPTAMQNQKAAVQSGQVLLYRYHPERTETGEPPLKLDSRRPKLPLREYLGRENRFRMLTATAPDRAAELAKAAQHDVDARYRFYEYLSKFSPRESSQAAAEGDAAQETKHPALANAVAATNEE